MRTRLSNLAECGLDQFNFAGMHFPKHVWTLPKGPIKKRLSDRKGACTSDYYHAPKPIHGRHPGQGFYLDDAGMPARRWTWCDEVAGMHISHNGWYCDRFGDQTIRGIVVRLPHGRFLAGWSMGERMASAVDGTIYTDEVEAAYAADEEARVAAEKQIEYEESLNEDGEPT